MKANIVGFTAAAAAVLFVPLGSPAANTTLIATVGTNDGLDIGLADTNGTPVVRIPPGTYDIVVRDRSTQHNFHLASNEDRTVDFRTELDFVGEMTFTVTFKDGVRYAYACEPHWQTMNGAFFVGADTPPPPPKPKPLPTLRAGVTAGGTAFVSRRSVRAGRYRVLVNDRSRRANFHLAGRGLNRRTGTRFTGRSTWSLRLRRGTYRFGSDPEPLDGRLRVR